MQSYVYDPICRSAADCARSDINMSWRSAACLLLVVAATASSPTTMHFTVTYEYGPFQCQGAFSGTLNVTSRALDGPFSGQNCVRPFDGTFHATKID